MSQKYDYIIIGAGIIGLCIARKLRLNNPDARILILEKEDREAFHASSRNSGVLHAGFYYTADSLKAKLTVEGNHTWKFFCEEHNLPVNKCGKLVVAQNEEDHAKLFELQKRGQANGSNVTIIDENQVREIDSNVRTHKHALWSPDTASVDPKLICKTLKNKLIASQVVFEFSTKYIGHHNNIIKTNKGEYEGTHIINCAGLYADKIAHEFGFGMQYTIIPFKGLYLKYTKNKTDIKTNIYPVPNLKNPFLGVHFTITVDGTIKIGPTAIPAFWRENYQGLHNFKMREMFQIMGHEAKLFMTNAFGFRNLALEEMQKYNKDYFVKMAQNMVHSIDTEGFTEFTKPGIRAQLLDTTTHQLLQDFVVQGDKRSTHVLNAVSPAFTCAIPFAEYVIKNHIQP